MKPHVFVAFVLFALTRAVAAEAVADPAVQLPAYTVTDTPLLPPPESWRYARIEGFEVLSNTSAKNTQDIVQHLQRFALALDTVWPGGRQLPEPPTALVICGRGAKFDEFSPPDWNPMQGRVTLALRTREHSAIVVDYQQKTLDLDGGNSALDSLEINSYQQLCREYVRFVFGVERSPFPPWFVEGIAQIFMTMEVSPTLITVGRLEDPDLVSDIGLEWDRTFNGYFRRNPHLRPIEQVLALAPDTEEVRNPINSVWAKEATAFVHWGLYGNFRREQKAFLQFVQRLSRGEPLTEELFKACFKRDYANMTGELRSYVTFTPYKAQEFRAKQGERLPEPPPVAVRDATEAESARIRGDTLRVAGRTEVARGVLLAAYIRGERDPQLLAALGLVELERGDTARARKFLEAALPAKPVRPRAYLELARLRLAELEAAKPGAAWNVTQVGAVAAPLLVARTQPPPLPEVYEMLASLWVRATAVPAIDQLKIADEGVRRFPRDVPLIHDSAVLMLRAGRPADAAMIVRHGLGVARDPADRARLQQLQAKIPVAPAK
jgi:hypothetical protein